MDNIAVDHAEVNSWTARLLRIPNIFVEPAEVFDHEAREPNAMLPLIVLSIGLGTLLMAYSGLMVNIALSVLPASQRPGLESSTAAMIDQNKWIGAALVPLYVGASALIVGILVYSIASATARVKRSDGADLHRSISIAAYASLAILLEQLLTYVTLRVIGFENVRYFWDLKPLPGLHYLVSNPDLHRVAFAVLERINFFTGFYGFLLAYGMRRVFRTSRMIAGMTAVVAVLGGVVVVSVLAWAKP